MQRKSAKPGQLSGLGKLTLVFTFFIAVASGCSNEGGTQPTPKAKQPFAGAKLKLACPDATVSRELGRRATMWAQRQSATITIEVGTPTDADILIVPPRQLGRWVESKQVKILPDEFRATTHAMQWSRVLTSSSDRLASWGGEPYAVPLAGEAYVLVYRTDRFADPKLPQDYLAKYGRKLVPPTTWEEYTEIAEFFAAGGSPSLLALPEDSHRYLREFYMIAACYDRPSVAGTSATPPDKDSAAKTLAFHHDIATGEPRLLQPGFLEAAKLFQRTARCRMPRGMNSLEPLVKGSVVMAVLSLPEMGQLPKTGAAAPTNLAIAPLPGTRVWFDPADRQPKPPGDKVRAVNYVPYFGEAGWVGIVPGNCVAPDAAFDLLTDLASLSRSVELLSDPALGFGPFRAEHLEEAREVVWQRYGFDTERTKELAHAIRHYVGVGLANPVVTMRGADEQALTQLLSAELAKVAAGGQPPDVAMKVADAAWRKADTTRPAETLRIERRRSAGLR